MNNMYGFQPNFNYQQNPYLPSNVYQGGFQQQVNPFSNQQQEILQGSIVDSVDVVRAKNCLLDGSPTYYPLSDKKEIYCKQLNPQTGAGMMLRYKLVDDNEVAMFDNNQIANMISQLQNEVSELKTLVLDTLTLPNKGGAR